jgi:dolichol-phosphate mannosyltransferase
MRPRISSASGGGFWKKLTSVGFGFWGYAFQVEMKCAAYRHGFRLVEIPIVFVDRIEGVSKIGLRIFKEAVVGVAQMRFRSWSGPSN